MTTVIQVLYRLHEGDQRWRVSKMVYLGAEPSSAVAVVDGQEVVVVAGWWNGRARLWIDRTGTDQPISTLPVLAELADGPVELEGPRARWRWRVVT